MCGLIGCLNPQSSSDSRFQFQQRLQTNLQNALKTIKTRGPDAEGVWQDDQILLGHRRLSIVDVSQKGNQPMAYRSLVITFNGMIYNYRDIRKVLIQKGHRFETNTDTEVLLAGWAEWQWDLLPRLQGMFAFAIWDKTERKLILARDRFGKKPLYFRNWHGVFTFGSRFDAVEAFTETAQLSGEALSWLLTLKYIPEPLSASDEIKKLPAGHVLEIVGDTQTIKKWYHPKPDAVASTLSKNSQEQKLRSLLDQAVAKRLVSDVPIACFLSGGIDSAIIASLAKNTFSWTLSPPDLMKTCSTRPKSHVRLQNTLEPVTTRSS